MLRRSHFFHVSPCGATYFAHSGKVGKTLPGDGSDERLRAAGAHSHLSPGPPVTGAGHFGWSIIPGGQNQDLFSSYSRATGSSSSQSPLYSGRPLVGIRHVASLLLLSPPNPLRWALAGAPIMGSSNIHRLVPAYLFGACVVRWTAYPGFARVGGVISTHLSTRFCTGRGLCPRGKKNARSCVRSRRMQVPII